MAWTKYQMFLALLMVATGSINTLVTKFADESDSAGRDGKKRKFNHPFLQAVAMFFGEFLCFVVYKVMLVYYLRFKSLPEEQLPESIKGNRKFNPFIFMLPALCDMTATSLMYIGLNLTNSSSFQMLRGALIIFTGILTILILKRRLKIFHWVGIILIMGGLITVGLSDFFQQDTKPKIEPHLHGKDKSGSNVLLGDLLIIVAQIITATQMIVEEKYVAKHNVSPLQAVGWEGIFGFVTLSLLMIPMYFIHVGNAIFKNPDGQIEDAIDGFYQIINSWKVATGITGTIFSIAFFNFAGISVTKQLSATTRTVLDSVRTVIIWVVSLAIGQEHFHWAKLGGFAILLTGMCIYNDILIRPALRKFCCPGNSDSIDITPAMEQEHPYDVEAEEEEEQYGAHSQQVVS